MNYKFNHAFDISEELKNQMDNKFRIEEIPFFNNTREDHYITL